MLSLEIARIHQDSRGTYGAPRIQAELRLGHGTRCGRKRVARLMRQAGLCGVTRRRRYRSAQGLRDTAPAADLVQRDFQAAAPGALWVADITYVPTAECFLYLAVVLDVFSRKIAGWAMRRSLDAEVVTSALDMAISRSMTTADLVHHSDRGSQGGINRSSQQLADEEMLRWEQESVDGRIAPSVRGCVHLVVRQRDGASINSGSGQGSLAAWRARMPAWPRVCLQRSEHGGSVKVGAWPQSPLHSQAATCRSSNAKRSPSFTSGTTGYARLPGG